MTAKKQSKKEVSEEIVDDIDFEPDAEGDRIKKLKEQLAECKTERQEYLDGWQRLKADTVNARRDDETKRARAVKTAQEEVFGQLIPVMDSFDMARKGEAWEKVDATWRAGIDGIIAQLEGVFATYGITRFGEVGDTFDPMLHEAMSETAGDGDKDTVANVERVGWRTSEGVLRPAQVTVLRAK